MERPSEKRTEELLKQEMGLYEGEFSCRHATKTEAAHHSLCECQALDHMR